MAWVLSAVCCVAAHLHQLEALHPVAQLLEQSLELQHWDRQECGIQSGRDAGVERQIHADCHSATFQDHQPNSHFYHRFTVSRQPMAQASKHLCGSTVTSHSAEI